MHGLHHPEFKPLNTIYINVWHHDQSKLMGQWLVTWLAHGVLWPMIPKMRWCSITHVVAPWGCWDAGVGLCKVTDVKMRSCDIAVRLHGVTDVIWKLWKVGNGWLCVQSLRKLIITWLNNHSEPAGFFCCPFWGPDFAPAIKNFKKIMFRSVYIRWILGGRDQNEYRKFLHFFEGLCHYLSPWVHASENVGLSQLGNMASYLTQTKWYCVIHGNWLVVIDILQTHLQTWSLSLQLLS